MNQSVTNRERRRAKRVGCDASVRYQTGREQGGQARVVDVDHGGLCLELAHPVAAQQKVMVEVVEPTRGDGTVVVTGRVVWCGPCAGGYRAGVRIYHDEPDVRVALCALMCAALKRQAAVASMRDRHFIYVEWKLAALDANQGPQRIWRRRSDAPRPVRTAPAFTY